MNANEYQEFQSSLEHGAESSKHGPDAYFGKHITTNTYTPTKVTGLSLRELIHDLRYQTLVLVKALLLQKRV